MKATFSNAEIRAIACCVPAREISLYEQADILYNGDIKKVERITKTIGLDKRRIVDSQTTTLDLCYDASLTLLEQNDKAHIDAIIFVTQTPDFLQPNNAHLLHHKLNLSENCLCFDVNQGCSGYVYGLFLAYMLIEKGANQVLLCAGDTLSKVVHPNDSNTTPIFGDAGSATLIGKTTNQESFFSIHSSGKGWDNIVLPNSGYRKNYLFSKYPKDSDVLQMDGAEVFNFSIDKEPKAIEEILHLSNKKINQIDYIFFHQANAYIISNIARRLKLDPSKAPCQSIAKYGNTSSASIPLAICDALDFNPKTIDIILSGFGVGLSWASAMLTLQEHSLIYKPTIYKQGE